MTRSRVFAACRTSPLTVSSNDRFEGSPQLVRRHEPRPENGVGIDRFAQASLFRPRTVMVKTDEITRNDIQRIGGADIRCRLTDDHAQFYLYGRFSGPGSEVEHPRRDQQRSLSISGTDRSRGSAARDDARMSPSRQSPRRDAPDNVTGAATIFPGLATGDSNFTLDSFIGARRLREFFKQRHQLRKLSDHRIETRQRMRERAEFSGRTGSRRKLVNNA